MIRRMHSDFSVTLYLDYMCNGFQDIGRLELIPAKGLEDGEKVSA